MVLTISSGRYVTKPCHVCHRGYVDNHSVTFNPVLYFKGLCCDCNLEILKHLLKTHYRILKNVF
jgi:hypothetical protein